MKNQTPTDLIDMILMHVMFNAVCFYKRQESFRYRDSKAGTEGIPAY